MNQLPTGTDIRTSRFIRKDKWQDFSAFMGMAFQPGRGYSERMGKFQKQIDDAKAGLANLKNTKSIDFDFTIGNSRENAKLLSEVPKIWEGIIDNIDCNDNWLVVYKFGDVWRSRRLDEVNREYLRDQMNEEFKRPVIEGSINLGVKQADYNFFPDSIRSLRQVRFVNTKKFNGGNIIDSTGESRVVKTARWEESDVYRRLMRLKSLNPDDVDDELIATARMGWVRKNNERGIQVSKRPYVRKQGSFWKWLCKLPINLERYMIFNELNERTIHLMEQDNCLIYACKQFGVPEDIIDHMKDIIKTKSFTLSKLKEIAKDTGVSFYVEEKDGRHHKIGTQEGIVVPLLLLNEHYMLNERVKISPYYIKHYNEILNDPIAMKKSLEDRQLIMRRRELHGKLYYISENHDYPLKLVLKTLFSCDYFEPIKMGEYLTYASTLYKYKLDPIDNLDYNPKFCCRLKAPPNEAFRAHIRER